MVTGDVYTGMDSGEEDNRFRVDFDLMKRYPF